VKRALLREAESLIDEMLEWQQQHPESDFDGMETQVQEWRRRFGQELVEKLLELQAQRRPATPPVCPDCHRPMRYKGMVGLTFESFLGVVEVARGYYYCRACQKGLCPLDAQLHLAAHWSGKVARAVTWLNGHTQTYGESVAIVAELTDARISKSSSWRVVQTYGARFQAELTREETQLKAQAREWSTPGGPPAPHPRMGVALDGGLVCLRGEGWKEFKAGCVFEVAPRRQRDPRTGDVETYGHAVNLSYVAHLGEPGPLGWQVWTEAHRRGWRQAPAGQVVGDGAAWVWGIRDDHFPDTETVVDWYHATEHLGEAKQLLFAAETAAGTRWYNELELALYQGHADRVAQCITQAAQALSEPARAEVLQQAHYFAQQQRRMHYLTLRNEGWVIGSGMIESGVKRFKARFVGAGMRWSRAGVENLLPVRAAVLSGEQRFAELWQRAYAA
jgi:hypothetical protein